MKNANKYILLYMAFVASVFAMYYPIDVFSKKNIETQKEILIKQAQTHFSDQVNTRKWNASYGGVYVKPRPNDVPNPYLRDNVLRVDENLTLIKINPAWMTRQLSEIAQIEDFHFRITSLNPLNPDNVATPFEREALEYFAKTNQKEYYTFEKGKFNYMGALITTQDCLACHAEQGYKLGDIRGGISIALDSSKYEAIKEGIKEKVIIVKGIVLFFLLSITVLIHKQLSANKNLQSEVRERTKEIASTQQLLQNILDAEPNLLILTDETQIIYTNKTVLDFFALRSLEEFKERYVTFGDMFEKVDEEQTQESAGECLDWIECLRKEQRESELKIVMKHEKEKRYFRPEVRELEVEGKRLYLISLAEITKEFRKMEELRSTASIDPLTGLFNRAKFNEVIEKEMGIAQSISMPLAVIFFDIDHFKAVNDTYGHDAGDRVLAEVASLVKSTLRQGDFVARWGGEEFVVALQSVALEQAHRIAETLRLRIKNHRFEGVPNITVSFGVTCYIEGETKESLLKRVDKALYEAKQNGRNRVASR
jgi:diguanylate cyclase (GGDEF)-like protein